METDEQNLDAPRSINIDELNIEILPVIYEIIRRCVNIGLCFAIC